MSPLLIPGIKAGASIIGALIGKDDGPDLVQQKNYAQATEQERYKWLVKGAQDAGFNPSSVLQATGGNFGNAQGQYSSPLNTGALIGDAIATFADDMDPVKMETERLNNEILSEELKYLRSRRASPIDGGQTMRQMQTTKSPSKNSNSPNSPSYDGIMTAFGDMGDPKEMASEAKTALEADQGFGGAYDHFAMPPGWPTVEHVEGVFGDESFVKSLYSKAVPFLIAGHNYQKWSDWMTAAKAETKKKRLYREAGLSRKSAADRARYLRERPKRNDPAYKKFMRQNYPSVFD